MSQESSVPALSAAQLRAAKIRAKIEANKSNRMLAVTTGENLDEINKHQPQRASTQNLSNTHDTNVLSHNTTSTIGILKDSIDYTKNTFNQAISSSTNLLSAQQSPASITPGNTVLESTLAPSHGTTSVTTKSKFSNAYFISQLSNVLIVLLGLLAAIAQNHNSFNISTVLTSIITIHAITYFTRTNSSKGSSAKSTTKNKSIWADNVALEDSLIDSSPLSNQPIVKITPSSDSNSSDPFDSLINQLLGSSVYLDNLRKVFSVLQFFTAIADDFILFLFSAIIFHAIRSLIFRR
jgi:hypothetical protein